LIVAHAVPENKRSLALRLKNPDREFREITDHESQFCVKHDEVQVNILMTAVQRCVVVGAQGEAAIGW